MARSKKPQQRIRVREVPLDRIDESKLALAFWLMAKRRIEEDEAAPPKEQSAP